ncbi:MAG: isochorismatase family protein [Caulobacteraceae bacterium]
MSTLKDRPKTALLVVDVQVNVVAGAHDRDQVVGNIARLIEKARAAKTPVIWVQHHDEGLAKGSEAWRIVPELKPAAGEPLIEKSFGDSFEATDLESVLADHAVGRLVVSGA